MRTKAFCVNRRDILLCFDTQVAFGLSFSSFNFRGFFFVCVNATLEFTDKHIFQLFSNASISSIAKRDMAKTNKVFRSPYTKFKLYMMYMYDAITKMSKRGSFWGPFFDNKLGILQWPKGYRPLKLTQHHNMLLILRRCH